MPVCGRVGRISRLGDYHGALRFHQICAGFPDPALSSFPCLTYILKGIHCSKPDHQRKHRLPITIDILNKLHEVWSQAPVDFNRVMLWAACCLGFFGFLRSGEFTCSTSDSHEFVLTPADITVDSRSDPILLTIHLRHSKTDPFGVGCRVFVGWTGSNLCTVAAVLHYLSFRPESSGRPLFIFDNGSPLSRVLLVQHLRSALSQAGIATQLYSGHSFRVGAATAAARVGFSDSFIQTLGRWKSSAFMSNIRTPLAGLASVAAELVHTFLSLP